MKTFSIAGTEIENRYCLAPLAGFSDHSTRRISYEYGARLLYTEMESVDALCFNSKPTIKDLEDTKLDRIYCKDAKLAVQIFGGREELILQAIPIVEKIADYDFLDFNCGCPVPKVIRQHAGSSWLEREEELYSLLKRMVSISSKPVIIKIRIGYSSIMDVVPFVKRLQECGVKAIAVHGRTRSEFFSSRVHYDIIKDIKKNVSIPVIANGEIDDKNFLDVLDETGADAVMIGQHALGYPRIFKNMIDIEEGRKPAPISIESQLSDLRKHIDYIFDTKDERSAASIMRSFSTKYMRGFDDSRRYRSLLVHCDTKDDYLKIIDNIQNEQNNAHLTTNK